MGRAKPLARKMMNLIGGILAVSMLLSTAAFTGFEYFAIRQSLVTSLGSQASVIGLAAGPSLVFENPQDTVHVLGTLKNSKNIEKAAVYLANGDWFAGYPGTLQKAAFPAITRGRACCCTGVGSSNPIASRARSTRGLSPNSIKPCINRSVSG